MKKLNVVAGVVFGLTGLVSLLSHDWLQAGAWLTLGGGLYLSDLHYRSATTGATASGATLTLTPARRYLSMGLVLTAIALFGYLIGHDLQNKLPRATSQHTAR